MTPAALLTLAAEHTATAARLRGEALESALVATRGSRREAALLLSMPWRTFMRALAALPPGRLVELAARHRWPSRSEVGAAAYARRLASL